jgi:hypothetical protein
MQSGTGLARQPRFTRNRPQQQSITGLAQLPGLAPFWAHGQSTRRLPQAQTERTSCVHTDDERPGMFLLDFKIRPVVPPISCFMARRNLPGNSPYIWTKLLVQPKTWMHPKAGWECLYNKSGKVVENPFSSHKFKYCVSSYKVRDAYHESERVSTLPITLLEKSTYAPHADGRLNRGKHFAQARGNSNQEELTMY